ncbi:hypothetical protein JOE50_004358 [Bradyrhizobium japonicum]|nr:hypothetical protein [Bradyrhizobium japonicum]
MNLTKAERQYAKDGANLDFRFVHLTQGQN